MKEPLPSIWSKLSDDVPESDSVPTEISPFTVRVFPPAVVTLKLLIVLSDSKDKLSLVVRESIVFVPYKVKSLFVVMDFIIFVP